MQIDLDRLMVQDRKVLECLVRYLDKVRNYQSFNPFAKVRVFVNRDGDFTAFEALDYNLQFTSSAHKLSETINSPYVIAPVSFDRFFIRVEQLAREADIA